jgi:uncharacterized protein YndB with AHSA1/START domain
MSTSVPDETEPMVLVTEEIAASPSFVFDTLLDADEFPEWFRAPGGGETHGWSLDPKPGGEWSASTITSDGRAGRLEGEFTEVDAPHTLAFTWHDSEDPNASGLVRFTLDELVVDGESWTRLTVTHATACAVPTLGASALGADWMLRIHDFATHLTRYLVVASA